MNMSAAGTGASAAAVNPALAAMGRAYPAPAAAMRAYPVKAEPEQKQVTTEQIQVRLRFCRLPFDLLPVRCFMH